MRFFKALTFIILMGLVSVSMTGCDASKIIDVISKVAEGVQKAIPAVKEVINSVSNALPQNTDTATNNNTTSTNNNEQTASNNANVTITSAGDDEDVGNTTTTNSATTNTTNSTSTAQQTRIASSIRSLLGSTSFRGADVDGGNLACAKVVSTALQSAGVLSRVQLNCDAVVNDLKAVGWQRVNVPPYQEGDVVTWTTSRGPGRHIGIIVKQGNTFQAISNSSSERTPRVHAINYMPITQVLRKV